MIISIHTSQSYIRSLYAVEVFCVGIQWGGGYSMRWVFSEAGIQ